MQTPRASLPLPAEGTGVRRPALQAIGNAVTLDPSKRGQNWGRGSERQAVCRSVGPLKTLRFTLKQKQSLRRVLRGGVIGLQRTGISVILDFYVTMNMCYLCNQKKDIRTLRRLRKNKQTRTSCVLRCQPVDAEEREARERGLRVRGSEGLVRKASLHTPPPRLLGGRCSPLLSTGNAPPPPRNRAWTDSEGREGPATTEQRRTEFFPSRNQCEHIPCPSALRPLPSFCEVGARLLLEDINEWT